MWVSFHWQDGQTMDAMAYDLSQTLMRDKVPAIFWSPSTASPTGSPAKTSPSPGNEQDLTATDPACSSKPPESSERCARQPMDATQLGLSLRTSQDSCQPTTVMQWGASSMSWPTSGRWESSGEWWTRSTSGWPNDGSASLSSLASILEESVPTRYFLSARAARGILNRAQRRGRTLPEPLHAALSALSGGGLTDLSPALMAKAQRNHPDEEAFVIERERERRWAHS